MGRLVLVLVLSLCALVCDASVMDSILQRLLDENEAKNNAIRLDNTMVEEGISEDAGEVEIPEKGITEIPRDAFKDFPKLHHIQLALNNINKIEPEAFRGVGPSAWISLHDNSLTEIKKGMFDGMVTPKEIDLDRNKIKTIQSGSFSDLGDLKYLRLNGNLLEELKSGMFDGLAELQFLQLEDNKLKEIQDETFKGLPLLHFLLLSGNELTEIKTHTFDGLDALQDLGLMRNKISTVEDRAFAKMHNLGALRLGSNQIEQLSASVFGELADRPLLEIGLWRNPLQCDDSAFCWLEERLCQGPITDPSMYSGRFTWNQNVFPECADGTYWDQVNWNCSKIDPGCGTKCQLIRALKELISRKK